MHEEEGTMELPPTQVCSKGGLVKPWYDVCLDYFLFSHLLARSVVVSRSATGKCSFELL